MAKINLPKDILERSALKSLPAKEKEEYLNNLLKKVLDINPEGVTISQIKESIGLTPSTIWHHLEMLKSTAQCRKISHGNMDVYHPYGKEEQLGDFDTPRAKYTIGRVQNEEGTFVCIHDKRKNRQETYTVVRGIAIPDEILDDVINTLSNAKRLLKK